MRQHNQSEHGIRSRDTSDELLLAREAGGGRTIFDGAGVGVEPRPGSALVWWNIRSDGSLDSR